MSPVDPIARVVDVTHRYGTTTALAGVTVDIPSGRVIGLIGPDGVGKSTLLGLIAGAKKIQSGQITVLGGGMSSARHRRAVCPRIAYMPQGLGSNLYAELSVGENIEFFGRLFGLSTREREERLAELLKGTGLVPFRDRPAKKLSGGMKQKLGLCCALIHDPDILILDEPTTGVDPLSRRQFWRLIDSMRDRRPGMNVLVATAYMEEAEQFDWLIALHAGTILASGTADEFKTRTGRDTLEAAFVELLPEATGYAPIRIPALTKGTDGPAIVARELTRRFGDFVAVERVNFSIARGEIFGFVGSNGCGKTTTMKMLTGLLAPSGGEAHLFGRPIDSRDRETRRRVGYMSQSFSLYGELTVRQNLELHARLFHVPPSQASDRIGGLIDRFGLAPYVDTLPAGLPLGIRQRLSLAVAIVHAPEILILDEPTSGVDPIARDKFWQLLVDLSRRQGVTIFISTHFMNEAERCDRVSLMHAGQVLVTDTPAALIASRSAVTLEEAFIDYLADAAGGAPDADRASLRREPRATRLPVAAESSGLRGSLRRLLAYSYCEALEIWRDPVRLAVSLLGSVLLMLVFGYGITMDVERLTYVALDRDQTPESRRYLEELGGSRYFVTRPPVPNQAELEAALMSGRAALALEIPPGFGRSVKRGTPTEVSAWVDGAMPFRAETIAGYLLGLHQAYLADVAVAAVGAASPEPAKIATRFRYNQDFKSVYAMVPSNIALLLAFIPAILMAVGIVREKELGSIVNLYVTPVRRLEFLLGKQLPYVGLATANYVCLLLMAVFLFGVPLKGSVLALTLGAVLYVTATTGVGLLVSAFTRTQIAALFGTAIVTVLPATQFSGMLMPVSSLSGAAAIIGSAFPTKYFLHISVGTFTKALHVAAVLDSLLALAIFIPVLTALSLVLLPKQDR